MVERYLIPVLSATGIACDSGVAVRSPSNQIYIWTDYHVIAHDVRVAREIIEGAGIFKLCEEKKCPDPVEFKTLSGGRGVAEILRWDEDADLALLRVTEGGDGLRGVRFNVDKPKIGQSIWFCGNSMSQFGCVTEGVVSFVGREKGKFDQCSAPTFPGASGGMIADRSGRVLGLVRGGPGETFTLYVPARIMKEKAKSWGKRNGLDLMEIFPE